MNRIGIIVSFTFLLITQSGITQSKIVYSADSLFNLGNRAYADNQFDEAVFNYERAKLLDPNAMDIATNLQLANENLSTDIIEVEPFFLAKWWMGWSHLMLPGGWGIVSIALLISALILTYILFLTDKIKQKRTANSVLIVLAVFFIISILAGNTRQKEIFQSPFGIVMGNDQSLYEGPDEISEKVKSITGGNKLRILDEDGDWYKVSAMDSEQGWLKKENVERLSF